MPKSADFKETYASMLDQYGKEKGEQVYYAWLNEHGYDDTKPRSSQKNGTEEKKMATEDFFKWYAVLDTPAVEKTYDENGKKFYVGVASSTSIDRDNEVMSKGVLEKATTQLVGKPVFFNHNHKELGVGKIVKSWMESGLLMIKVQPTAALGMKDVLTQMDEGILSAFSVGGKAIKKETEMRKDQEVRVIKEAEFMEVSVVGIPANPDALILGAVAKGLNMQFSEEPVEKAMMIEKPIDPKVKVVSKGESLDVGDHIYVALADSSFGIVSKSRFAVSANDEEDKAEGDEDSEDEKAPVVPKKKKKQKDGSKIEDDEARVKGGDMEMVKDSAPAEVTSESMGKEVQLMTPNQPALGLESITRDLAEIKELLRQSMANRDNKFMEVNSKGDPKLPEVPKEGHEHKSMDLTNSESKIEKAIEKMNELDAKLNANPKGLMQKEAAYDDSSLVSDFRPKMLEAGYKKVL